MSDRTKNKSGVEKLSKGDFKTHLVSQHNDLIHASYSLSVLEKKLLLGCICKVNSFENINASTPFSFSMNEAEELFGFDINNSGMVKQLRKAAQGLMTKVVTNDFNDDWQDCTFAHTASYDAGTKTMTVYFSHGILPYLSELKRKFTTYRIIHVGKLTSKYSIRLYEFLVMWLGQNKYKETARKFTIEDFNKKIANNNPTYNNKINMLKRRVVNPALEQINNETDVNLEVEYHKTGRSITHIELKFNLKDSWREIEKDFKRKLNDNQIAKIVNHREFFNKYYINDEDLGVPGFYDKAKRLLAENPNKYYPDYLDYLKD